MKEGIMAEKTGRMDMRTRRLTTCAVMAALIFVVTWTVRIPVPISGGAYVNFGDAVIDVCAFILGGPLAAISAGLGSALADVAAGSAVYAPATLVIKACMALVAGWITTRQTFGRYAVGCIAAGAVMVGGYALFEFFFFGETYAAASIPFNCIQWAGSVLVALVLFKAARQLSAHFGFRARSTSSEEPTPAGSKPY